MHSNQLAYWLAALYLPTIGPKTLQHCLASFADIEHLFKAHKEEWKALGLTDQQIQALQHPDWRSVEQDLVWAQKEGRHLISMTDENYPPLLKELSDPPFILYVQGDVTVLKQTQMAMVGSRHATSAGIKNAELFAEALAQAGLVITSGLALGIDAASHRGALMAKGKTIAVFGTGLNHIYPRSHRKLVTDILQQQGAIISEFPLATLAHPGNFPRRNRIISGLSIGVLVVEAAIKSGSLITARCALEQGRDVFALPGSIHNPYAKGCHHLIQQGAKLVTSVEDILEETNSWYKGKIKTMSLAIKLTSVEEQVFRQIEYEITPIDMIILRSGLTASEVSSILLTLELNGYIQSVSGGYIREVLTT